MGKTEIITDYEIYEKVLLGEVRRAERFLWIGTSDLKDLHVDKNGKMVPFLEVLSDLIKQGVEIRLIHAKEPGPAFRADFDRYPNLINGMERILCPRIHLKTVVVDGRIAYTGSANLTGAGMGAKSKRRRNFEAGILTTDPEMIDKLMDQFDNIWMGKHCKDCGRKEYCADSPILT
ncbi:MAG: phospholipase [Planctomycetes bacterium]|nr:phospholipase [Planctomycetota bacterium]